MSRYYNIRNADKSCNNYPSFLVQNKKKTKTNMPNNYAFCSITSRVTPISKGFVTCQGCNSDIFSGASITDSGTPESGIESYAGASAVNLSQVSQYHMIMSSIHFCQTEEARKVQEIAKITLSDLANTPEFTEIENNKQVILRYSEDTVYYGYLVVKTDPFISTLKTCEIYWWRTNLPTFRCWKLSTNQVSSVPEAGMPETNVGFVLHKFKSPNDWKHTIEHVTGKAPTIRGFWDQTRLMHNGKFITLGDLRNRYVQTRMS